MWSAAELRALIERTEPDFLNAFLDYPDDVARWCVARFFILREEGGVAVKVGMYGVRGLEGLLPDAGAWFAGTYRGGDVGKEAEVSDAVCASRAGHPVWSGLAEDLWRCAKRNASQAAGGEFLTARRREFARFFPKASAPLICGPALFDSPAENEDVRLSREARREVRARCWCGAGIGPSGWPTPCGPAGSTVPSAPCPRSARRRGGGLIAFGVVGLFVGPVVLAVVYTLLLGWVKQGRQTDDALVR